MGKRVLPRYSVVKAVQVVGDAWLLLILDEIFRGNRRFSELQENLGISRAGLTTRLNQMVEDGILRRAPVSGSHRQEYRVAGAGKALWEVLLAIRQWELDWSPDTRRVRPYLMHTVCEQIVQPVLCCNACAKPVTPFNTSAKPGPGAGFDPWSGPGARRRSMTALRATSDGLAEQSGLQIFGDRWTPAIIATSFRGLTRFGEIESYLQIPPKILSSRLKELTDSGVLVRRPINGEGSPDEFRLTRKGIAIFPYISMLAKWGDIWLDDGKGVPLVFFHTDCGSQYSPVYRCSHCNGRLHRHEVRLLDRPLAPAAKADKPPIEETDRER